MRNQPICDDSSYIAESFRLDSEYIGRMARLASFKINSYKLSGMNGAFDHTRDELRENISSTLMHYVETAEVVSLSGFWHSEIEN
ncbi:MAG: hypothetical protein IPQ08_02465 [Chitinophagaceae bacterium]|nr:hypothetical protein [Chitinophagaceae bacterium]